MKAVHNWVLALVLAGSSPLAHADEGQFDLAALFGAHVFAEDLELGVSDTTPAASPRTFAMTGLRFGVTLRPWLGTEAEVAYVPTADSLSEKTVQVFGLRAHARLQRTSGSVRPFLLLGAGVLVASGDGNGVETIDEDVDFVPHWGAGLRVGLGAGVALRFEGRHLLAPNREDGLAHDFEIQGSLAVTLDAGE